MGCSNDYFDAGSLSAGHIAVILLFKIHANDVIRF
jgi:hypothetical protein